MERTTSFKTLSLEGLDILLASYQENIFQKSEDGLSVILLILVFLHMCLSCASVERFNFKN